MTKENYSKLTDVVGALMFGERVNGYKFLSVYDIRILFDVYTKINEEPTFINGNVKKVLDKFGVKTVTDGIGWKVVDKVEE